MDTKQRYTGEEKGFTLVETLVALTVLLFAIVGPMTLVSDSLQSAQAAKSDIIAFYLAQEAIEHIRYVRDTNTINGETGTRWLDPAGENNNACADANGCAIDVTAGTISASIRDNPVSCDPLQFDGTFYRCGDFTDTIYSRTVYLEELDPGREARVTVEVTYKPGALPQRTLTIDEYLYNYQR